MIIKILISIVGVFLVLGWAFLYVVYKQICWTALILNSASKMKTGNDLQDQVDKKLKKNAMPSFIGFYCSLLFNKKKEKKNGDD